MSLEKIKFWGNPRTPVDGSTIRGTGKGKKRKKNPDRKLHGTGKESQDKKIKKSKRTIGVKKQSGKWMAIEKLTKQLIPRAN